MHTLQFLPLWPGAVVKLTPFRHQDRLDSTKGYVYLGRQKGRDVFVSRADVNGSSRKYVLWPYSYSVRFLNVK